MKTKKLITCKEYSDIFYQALMVIASLLFLLIVSDVSPIYHTILGEKAGIVSIAQEVMEGKILYTDLYTTVAPLPFISSIIGLFLGTHLFGDVLTGLFFIEFLFYGFFSLYLYKTTRLYFKDILALGLSFCFLLMLNWFMYDAFVEMMVITFLQMMLYYISKVFMNLTSPKSKYNACFIGGLGSLIMFSSPRIAIVLLALLLFLGVGAFFHKIDGKTSLKLYWWLLIGFSLPTLLLVIPFFFIGNLLSMFHSVFFWALSSEKGFQNFEGSNAFLSKLYHSLHILWFLTALMFFVSVVERKSNLESFVAVFSLIGLSVFTVMDQVFKYPSLLILSVLMFYLLSASSQPFVSRIVDHVQFDLSIKQYERTVYAFLAISLIVTSLLFMNVFGWKIDAERKFYVDGLKSKYLSTETIVNKLSKFPQFKLFVLGSRNEYYVFSEKKPNLRYLFQTAHLNTMTYALSEIQNHLLQNTPAVLIIDRKTINSGRPDEFLVMNEALIELVETQYRLLLWNRHEAIYVLNSYYDWILSLYEDVSS
jgi:hypothetical protein